MKKLGKLSINPEKVIKNEELVNLKGGLGGYYVVCRNVYYICHEGEIISCDTDVVQAICNSECTGGWWTIL
jgi:hypothetical protein